MIEHPVLIGLTAGRRDAVDPAQPTVGWLPALSPP